MARSVDRFGLRRVALTALAVVSLSTALPARAAPPVGSTLRVSNTGGGGLRLRQQPDRDSAILALIPEGAAVVVSGAARYADGLEWLQIRTGGSDGWASSSFLVATVTGVMAASAPPVAATGAPTVGGQATVAGTGGPALRVRASVGLDAPIAGHLSEGSTVTITGGPVADATGSAWYGIRHDGLSGWANGRYLAPVGGAANRNAPPTTSAPAAASSVGQGAAIAAAGLLYLGVPYVWGGATPGGWDCSGFVLYIVQEVTGRTLPRTTQAQIGAGTPVAAGDIRAGDLVFFANTYAPGITHVGIALGDGRFVHARSPTHGTVITSLADPYYASRFAGARRL